MLKVIMPDDFILLFLYGSKTQIGEDGRKFLELSEDHAPLAVSLYGGKIEGEPEGQSPKKKGASK